MCEDVFLRDKFCIFKQKTKRGRAIVAFLLPLIFFACDDSPSSSVDSPLDLPSTETALPEEVEPKVFLTKQQKSLSLSVLNRTETLLSLSDQIVFPDDFPKLKEEVPADLVPLEKFPKEEALNMKISSFCSYDKGESDETSSSAGRLVQELGGTSYQRQFSIFDLVPKEIFLVQQENQIFYCSFIFAFRNASKAFDHYQVAQQSIEPFFISGSSSSNSGNLILQRESESGTLVSLGREIVRANNVSKITISNLKAEETLYYHLFCDGMKKSVITSSGGGATYLVFIDLMLLIESSEEDVLKEEPVICRIFSEGKGRKITGISPVFRMASSNNYNNSLEMADSSSSEDSPVDPPLVVYGKNPLVEDSSTKNSKQVPDMPEIRWQDLHILTPEGTTSTQAEAVPLNSYFQFVFKDKSSERLSYQQFIDIKINTQCTNHRVLGKGEVFSREYIFPFRESWPLMATASEEMFMMGVALSNRWWRIQTKRFPETQKFHPQKRTHDRWNIQCLYDIQLVDRRTGKPLKNFQSVQMNRALKWSIQPYGIKYRPLPQHPLINPVVLSSTRHKRHEFLRLEDISEKAGAFHLEFPDILQDSFFQTEGHRLTQIKLKCYTGRDKNGPVSEEILWPFNPSIQNIIYLKILFREQKIKQFIQESKLNICRLIFYENDLIRYFSEELKIVGSL